MAPYYSDIILRPLRLAALLCLSAAACFPTAAVASSRVELYQTTVPVADRSDGAQSAAFQAALKVVLIRITGRRTADEDPALAPLLRNARRYVQQYRGAPDNMLWVAFDGAALERWLTQNGQPLWGRERPSTFVCLSVANGGGPGAIVTADDASELKGAIDAAAIQRGIPLIWPDAAERQRDRLDCSTSGSADLARAHGADAVLLGHASTATAAASVHWTHVFLDHGSEFSGVLDGVNRAADLYAGLYAASGTLAPIDIEIIGVTNLKDYASVQGYLDSLTFVAHVDVDALDGDVVRFRLLTRGGAESLRHALAGSGKLQSLPAGEDAVQRFQLRR